MRVLQAKACMNLFEKLGFSWDRAAVPSVIPTHSIERAAFRFYRMMDQYVWDASVLEGNPLTFPEVKTLLDGVTVGGRKISDQAQILNLAASSKHLLALVKANEFTLDKTVFAGLHNLVAPHEALEWGHFRGEGKETGYTPNVSLGTHGVYTPLPTVAGAHELNRVFSDGIKVLLEAVPQPFEKATAFFLFGALQQFYFDGNKRTSRFMMNGILMSAGIDAISVNAARAAEFNSKMVDFYLQKDATVMMDFLLDCHPDVTKIREAQSGICGEAGFLLLRTLEDDDLRNLGALKNPSKALITAAERQRRYDASEFANANVALEGFVRSKEAQAHADRFINGEIDLEGYLAPSYEDIHDHRK